MIENVERIDAISRGAILKQIQSDSEEEEVVTAIEGEDTITTVTVVGLDDAQERLEIEKAAKKLKKKSKSSI